MEQEEKDDNNNNNKGNKLVDTTYILQPKIERGDQIAFANTSTRPEQSGLKHGATAHTQLNQCGIALSFGAKILRCCILL